MLLLNHPTLIPGGVVGLHCPDSNIARRLIIGDSIGPAAPINGAIKNLMSTLRWTLICSYNLCVHEKNSNCGSLTGIVVVKV